MIEQKQHYTIEDLLEIMETLRGNRESDGCPWDKEQTHQTIRKNLIEETYEAAEAIDNDDSLLLKEELGDVLLQVVFHAQIEKEQQRFDFSDVVNDICQKLIVRHPHIFGNATADTAGQVLHNWEKIKQQTKGQTTYAQTLESVPATLPALMKAVKIQSRSAKAGVAPKSVFDSVAAVKQHTAALEDILCDKTVNTEKAAHALGDILFAAAQTARMLDIDPENQLNTANKRFVTTFCAVEALASEQNEPIAQLSRENLNKLWRKAEKNII